MGASFYAHRSFAAPGRLCLADDSRARSAFSAISTSRLRLSSALAATTRFATTLFLAMRRMSVILIDALRGVIAFSMNFSGQVDMRRRCSARPSSSFCRWSASRRSIFAGSYFISFSYLVIAGPNFDDTMGISTFSASVSIRHFTMARLSPGRCCRRFDGASMASGYHGAQRRLRRLPRAAAYAVLSSYRQYARFGVSAVSLTGARLHFSHTYACSLSRLRSTLATLQSSSADRAYRNSLGRHALAGAHLSSVVDGARSSTVSATLASFCLPTAYSPHSAGHAEYRMMAFA